MSLRRAAATHELEVGNISLSGLWVRIPDDRLLRRVRLSERLDLDLFSPDGSQHVRITARVARIVFTGPPDTHGLGLELGSLGAASRAAVDRLVAEAAAEAEERASMTPPALPPAPPPLPSNDPFLIAEPEFLDSAGDESP